MHLVRGESLQCHTALYGTFRRNNGRHILATFHKYPRNFRRRQCKLQ